MRLLSLTHPYMSGPDVADAQRALHDNPYGDFYQFKVDAVCGPITVSRFAAAKWHLGYEDFQPICGEKLRGFLAGKPLPADYAARRKARQEHKPVPHPQDSMAEKALAWALTKVGQHENPPRSNNSFATIEWGHGAMAWCNVFVSLAYLHAGSEAFSKSAQKWQYVPAMLEAAKAGNQGLKVIHFADLKPGDIIVHGPGAYHTTLHDRIISVGQRTEWDVGGNEGNLGYVYHDIHDAGFADAFIRVDR